MARNRRQITFDFEPNKSAKQVIEEIRAKAVKEVVKAKVEEKIKEVGPETPLEEITENVYKDLEIPEPTPPINVQPDDREIVGGPGSLPSPDDPKPEKKPYTASFASNTFTSPRSDQGFSFEEEVEEIIEKGNILELYGEPTLENIGDIKEAAAGAADKELLVTGKYPLGQGDELGGDDELTGSEYQGEVMPWSNYEGGYEAWFQDQISIAKEEWKEEDLKKKEEEIELQPYAQGGRWFAVTGYPGVDVAYFIQYDLPGGSSIYYYASREDLNLLDGIGEGNLPPIVQSMNYQEFKRGKISGGSVNDVVGVNENYSTKVERTLQAPTGEISLPEWAANDPSMKDLFYIGVAESWSIPKFLREMSKKESFRTRYPAFDKMLQLTSGDYEMALSNYKQFENQVKELNNRYGEEADVTELVNQAINKGYTVEDLKETYDIFDRAEKNADTLLAFQRVVTQAGLDFDITSPQGIVDFFKGSAPTEIYDLYEATSISEQAARLDLDNLSTEEAIEIAKNTPGMLTQQQVSTQLQQAARQIALYRDYIDLGSYGLDADTVVNLSLGYRGPDDMSEIEIAEIFSRIYKTDENMQNLSTGIIGSKSFQKNRQIRSIG